MSKSTIIQNAIVSMVTGLKEKVEIKIFFGYREDYTYSKGNLEDLTSSNNGMSELIEFLLEDNDRFETLTASQFIEEFESHMNQVYNRL